MFYWLFTEGRVLLGGCLAPLLCLTLTAPIVVSAGLGAGIQRTSEAQGAVGWKRGAKLFAHLIVVLGVSAVYLTLLGDMAQIEVDNLNFRERLRALGDKV